MKSFCTAKAFHIFLAKNGSVFLYCTQNILKCNILLTNNVVSFEQLSLDFEF